MSVVGLKVGPFEIVGPAWVPEPGAWYLARRAGNRPPTTVLVRVLPPDASTGDRAAVQRQFEALRGIEDPRVPAPVAYYEGTGALAISAVVGAPLSDAVRGRADEGVAMSPATLLDVVLEVAETLQRVHHRNRHHGHLDPEQIVLAADGSVWLFGFGSPEAEPDPRWMAPEQARGEPSGPATDQWSLAAVACSLVTGRSPWSTDPAAEALGGDPGPIVDPVERQWPALGRLLRRMLDRHPANRFPSLHPARQELLALARRAGGTSDRRELGGRLVRRRGAPLVDPPTADEMAMKPEIVPADAPVLPSPSRSASSSPSISPSPAPARPRPALPSEPIPVVRPDISEEVPEATRGRAEPPAEPPAPEPPSTPEIESVEPRDPSIEEKVDTAPTVVPPSDAGESQDIGPQRFSSREPPSVSEAWFDPPSVGQDPSLGLTGTPVTAGPEPALPPVDDPTPLPRPAPSASLPTGPPVPIERIAMALAGLLLVLFAAWVATTVL